jgi:hypothetical protein
MERNEKNLQENKPDWIENLIKRLLIRAYYKKFLNVGKYRIYVKNLYEYVVNDLKMDWIKEKPFLSKARKILHTYQTKFYKYKANERLKKLQNKYPTLQIIEAYYYLSLKEKCKLKNEDLNAFEEMLEILFAKIKKKKD